MTGSAALGTLRGVIGASLGSQMKVRSFSGPPPALIAAVKAIQQGGMLLTVLVVTIIFLMVVKPGS